MIIVAVTHGLVFLPVVLSICGPSTRITIDDANAASKDLVLKSGEGSDTDDSSDDDTAVDSTTPKKCRQSRRVLVIKTLDVESPTTMGSKNFIERADAMSKKCHLSRCVLVVKASDEEESTDVDSDTFLECEDAGNQYKGSHSMAQDKSVEVTLMNRPPAAPRQIKRPLRS
jgi:hypothetical protein